jgi:ABC-type branched-subunit amino acid transport system substrate-binding protein
MRKRVSLRLLCVLCASVVVFSLSSAAVAQSPLTPQELRGKQIYIQGTSPSGKEILAYIGESSLEVPGNTMACASCHALRGQGKPEGGIDPSNITWEALTKPYGVTHSSGRKHPAYTDRGLELAITRGVDPAGNKLLYAMPRYQMSKEDLADLVVYLKRLGTDTDPGIADDRITIGTALPAKGALSELGQAVKEVITAAFAELNAHGGIYNRQLELKFVETGDNALATRANIERLIKDEKVFAMTGVFLAGAEKDVTPLLAEQEVPLVGPLTLDPKIGAPLNRQVFYLMSGNAGQARALINFVAKQPEAKGQSLAVVYNPSELNASVVEAIKSQAEKDSLRAPQVYEYAVGDFDPIVTVKQLKEKGIGQVFYLGSVTDLAAFMTEAEKANWFPQILLQSGGVTSSVFNAPAGFEGKVFFTLPTAPSDQTTEGLTEYRLLAEKYKLPQKHLAAQISAYTGARLLIEGLKRAGKDLSRERLIQVLEGFYEYQTGLTPPITWGPNRRIGAMGAYVVRVDLKGKQFVPASGWVSIN